VVYRDGEFSPGFGVEKTDRFLAKGGQVPTKLGQPV